MPDWNILLIDASASMSSNSESVNKGIIDLFMEQKDNEERFTFLTFNTDVKCVIDTKFNKINSRYIINSITNKGLTSLYDAIGYVYEMIVSDVYEYISFTVITDGYENSSRIHTLTSLKNLRETIDKKYKLNVSFICETQGVLTHNSSIISHANESCEVSGDYEKAFRTVSRTMSRVLYPSFNASYSISEKNESGYEPLVKRQKSYSKKTRPLTPNHRVVRLCKYFANLLKCRHPCHY